MNKDQDDLDYPKFEIGLVLCSQDKPNHTERNKKSEST